MSYNISKMINVTEITRKLNKTTKWFNYQAYTLGTKLTKNSLREWNITVDGLSFDVDGIDGNMIVDAKCVGNAKTSPYTGRGGNLQSKVDVKQQWEMVRALYIINNSNFDSFTIVVNTNEAVEYFTQIADSVGFEINVNFFIVCTDNF